MSYGRRQHPRFAVTVEGNVLVGGRAIAGRTCNLSSGGVSVLLPAPIAVSTEIEIDLALVFPDEGLSEPLRLAAIVVWCTGLAGGWQIGAQFVALDGLQRSYLETFLHFSDEDPRRDDDDKIPVASPAPDTRRAD